MFLRWVAGQGCTWKSLTQYGMDQGIVAKWYCRWIHRCIGDLQNFVRLRSTHKLHLWPFGSCHIAMGREYPLPKGWHIPSETHFRSCMNSWRRWLWSGCRKDAWYIPVNDGSFRKYPTWSRSLVREHRFRIFLALLYLRTRSLVRRLHSWIRHQVCYLSRTYQFKPANWQSTWSS